MNFIKKNIELIVVAFIILFIFVTLVVFYENKLVEKNKCTLYSDNSFGFWYEERISDEYIKIFADQKEYVIRLSSEIIDTLEIDKLYQFEIDEDRILYYCDIAGIQDYLYRYPIEIKEVKVNPEA